jgi:hypothetical protein
MFELATIIPPSIKTFEQDLSELLQKHAKPIHDKLEQILSRQRVKQA